MMKLSPTFWSLQTVFVQHANTHTHTLSLICSQITQKQVWLVVAPIVTKQWQLWFDVKMYFIFINKNFLCLLQYFDEYLLKWRFQTTLKISMKKLWNKNFNYFLAKLISQEKYLIKMILKIRKIIPIVNHQGCSAGLTVIQIMQSV